MCQPAGDLQLACCDPADTEPNLDRKETDVAMSSQALSAQMRSEVMLDGTRRVSSAEIRLSSFVFQPHDETHHVEVNFTERLPWPVCFMMFSLGLLPASCSSSRWQLAGRTAMRWL